MSIYMKIDGVSGNVTAKGHKAWIAIKSLSSGFSRTIKTEPGMGAHRDSSIPMMHDIEITKMMDTSSSDIYQIALSAKVIPQLTIDCCHVEDGLTPHLAYTLSNVLVSNYNEFVSSSSGLPLEKITLHAMQIEKRFSPRDATNKARTPRSVGYKIETAQVM